MEMLELSKSQEGEREIYGHSTIREQKKLAPQSHVEYLHFWFKTYNLCLIYFFQQIYSRNSINEIDIDRFVFGINLPLFSKLHFYRLKRIIWLYQERYTKKMLLIIFKISKLLEYCATCFPLPKSIDSKSFSIISCLLGLY